MYLQSDVIQSLPSCIMSLVQNEIRVVVLRCTKLETMKGCDVMGIVTNLSIYIILQCGSK